MALEWKNPLFRRAATAVHQSTVREAVAAAGGCALPAPCRELLVVAACGSCATIALYQRAGVMWRSRSVYPGRVGRQGVSVDKKEGDGTTPGGLFPLGPAFGVLPNPGTAMEYRRITPESYYVDDVRSRFYNTWVEGEKGKDWISAERLSDYREAYAYAVVIGCNQAHIPGKGSAVFLHCGTQATAGCVAVAFGHMENILRWLAPSSLPHILIMAAEKKTGKTSLLPV